MILRMLFAPFISPYALFCSGTSASVSDTSSTIEGKMLFCLNHQISFSCKHGSVYLDSNIQLSVLIEL